MKDAIENNNNSNESIKVNYTEKGENRNNSLNNLKFSLYRSSFPS